MVNITNNISILYTLLFDSVPVGIGIMSCDGVLSLVNKKMLEILGSPGEENTLAINVLEYLPLQKIGLPQVIEKAFNDGAAVSSALLPYTSKWGKFAYLKFTVVPVCNEGNPKGLCILLIEDFTTSEKDKQDLNRLKSELEQNNKLLKTVIDAVPSLIWMKDNTGKYLHANKAFEEFNSFAPDGIVGKTDAEIWPSELVDALQEADKQAMECEYPIKITENIQHPTLGSRWYSTTKVGVCDSDKNIIGTVGISCDISKQHEQEQILSGALESLTNSLRENVYIK